jgi:hypothetical protein
MKYETLQAALSHAKRFEKLAKSCKRTDRGEVEYGRQSAALKRASLDLTMALADLRNGK